MTDLVEESNGANRDHSIIQVREEGERCETEISDVGNQTLSGNETNKDELLASLIEKKLPREFPKPDPTCIFRVPNKLGRDNENAFIPQVVPIGPYHHGGKKFEAMEQIKLWNLQCLLKRKPTPDTSLVKFVKEIRSKEEFLRNCYDENLGDHLSSDQFVEMMVVDGCFILELIREKNPISRYHEYFSMPEMMSIVINDLFLLENQLPWKVLDCLFNLTTSSDDSSLHKRTPGLICSVMNNWRIEQYSILEIMDNKWETWRFMHLLDNARDLLVGPLYKNKVRPYGFWEPIPSVTHLEEIGVKFQRATSETAVVHNLLQGKWSDDNSTYENWSQHRMCVEKPHSLRTVFNDAPLHFVLCHASESAYQVYQRFRHSRSETNCSNRPEQGGHCFFVQ